MAIHLKTKTWEFEAVISGRMPFQIRDNDRKFQVGQQVILEEYKGREYTETCPKYLDGTCGAWQEINDDEDLYTYGEDEAIDMEGCGRCCCTEREEDVFTGRRCLIRIKEVFNIGWELVTCETVAFTFEILNVMGGAQ